MRREKPTQFFTKAEEAEIVAAIKAAEMRTSGEIGVHLQNQKGQPARKTAERIFHESGMDETALRNGVLIYLDVVEHQFCIIGDKGIDEKTPDDFWDEIRDKMQNLFREKKFKEGLITGISMAGKALAEFFPRADDDINELPDQITKS